jgi:hypothetical protein
MAETASHSTGLSSFSIGEALDKGFKFFQANVAKILIAGVVYLLATGIPSAIGKSIAGDNQMFMTLMNILMQIWGAYVGLGMTRYMLSLIRGGNPELSMLFNNVDAFVGYLIMYIRFILVTFAPVLVALALTAVMPLFFFLVLIAVLPAVYFSIKYGFVLMLVADNKANGSEAFKMSADMTKGRELTLFAYGLVSGILTVIGLILLVVPGIVMIAVSGVGMMLLYEYALKHKGSKAVEPAVAA